MKNSKVSLRVSLKCKKDSAIAKLKKDYEDGKADYVQVKKSRMTWMRIVFQLRMQI